jgi:tRNA nucleotidyltransferase (CCA-adding enzyme)
MKVLLALMLSLPIIIKSFLHQKVVGHLRHASLLRNLASRATPLSFVAVQKENIDKMNNNLCDVVLTEEETELFSTLRKVVEDEKLGTTVRVAGGWVRDKLLGVGGKEDVDIALDNMAGNDFAMKLNDWHRKNGFKSFKIGLIQSNPEKSKHLETATVQLGRLSVDFVNLRTETYANDSRIPEMTFGTPLEDAMRRDLTINSLFYNIHTEAVEDFSGRGVADLIEGIIRTPLPALVTFQDDPLRVLRAVRFACRFQFDVSSDLLIAASDVTVKVALGTKVRKQ